MPKINLWKVSCVYFMDAVAGWWVKSSERKWNIVTGLWHHDLGDEFLEHVGLLVGFLSFCHFINPLVRGDVYSMLVFAQTQQTSYEESVHHVAVTSILTIFALWEKFKLISAFLCWSTFCTFCRIFPFRRGFVCVCVWSFPGWEAFIAVGWG